MSAEDDDLGVVETSDGVQHVGVLPASAAADCDHHWIGHLKGGEPLSVRICSLCGDPDWDDLRRQLSELDGATEPGPENAYPSTPGEFAARWNALDEDQRAGWLRAMAAESERAVLCKLRHGPRQHGTIDQLVRDVQDPPPGLPSPIVDPPRPRGHHPYA